MIELKAPMSIKNEYMLELYDKDGKLKDKAYAYNLVTNNLWKQFFSSSCAPFLRIHIGTGSGTPSTADRLLFNFLAAADTSRKSINYAYPTSTAVYTATFPASASSVGTLTEVGFSRAGSNTDKLLTTHAMLQDSEGNPITINKTDTDTLIVTATVHVTVTAIEPFILPPAPSSSVCNLILTNGTSIDPKTSMYALASKAYPNRSQIASIGTGYWSPDYANRCFKWSTQRIRASTGNNCYINCIGAASIGYVNLPNESIFPAYELQPMSVGTGDGATTSFTCPIPDFVENTEVITVDGVELTRNVDYTVDPIGNSTLNASAISAYSNFASNLYGGIYDSNVDLAYQFGIRALSFYGYYFGTQDKALYFDLGQEKACNALFIDSLAIASAGPLSPVSCTVTLEYSLDGSTWQTACSVNSQCVGADYLHNLSSNYKNILTKFEPISARYWRIYASGSSYIHSEGLGSGGGNSFFGYVGDGIVFKEPPAEGAEIKIKATINRPYKTSDYLIDWTVSAYF